MKTLTRIISATALAAMVLLSGCVKTEEQFSVTLSDNGGVIELSGQEAVATISFTATADWTATSSESWLTIDPTSGKSGSASVTIKASANQTDSRRNATVEITCGSAKAKVAVEQKEKAVLELSKSLEIISDEGGSFSVTASSTGEVKVKSISADWIRAAGTKALGMTDFRFEVSANEELEDREAVICFEAEGLEQTLDVLQKRKGAIILSSETIEVSSDAQTVDFGVKSNLDYTVYVERGCKWVSVVSTKALRDSTITLSISEQTAKQARSAKVFVESETLIDSAIVLQSSFAPAIVLSEKETGVAAAGGSFSVEVSSNVSVSVDLAGCSWIQKSSTKGTTQSKFSFTAAANPTYEKRSAEIFFVNTAEGLKEGFIVTQEARELSNKSTKFDPNAVVLSLGAISDIHVDGLNTTPGQKFKSALEQLRSQSAINDANGIDGIVIAGDLTNIGMNGTYTEAPFVKSIYESVFSPAAVPLVYTLGNHDTKGQWTSSVASEGKNLRNTFGPEYYTTDQDKEMGEKYEARHCVIKGYNILCVTPVSNGPVEYDPAVLTWLDNKLQSITSANPEQFVLVVTHPMIYSTVYGSELGSFWYTSQLTSILKKYPQAVTFGGHLHFPLNDPRSVWQGDFTSFGCGSVRYMAFEGGQYYANKAGNTTLNDKDLFSQGLLVQFDASGNMRATRMDFFHNETIDIPWEISYPDAVAKTHLQKYNHATLKAANASPVIETVKVELNQTNQSTVPCKAVWSAAKDDEFAHHYELTFTKPDKSEEIVWIMSDFYLNAKRSTMRKEYEYKLGTYPAGSYNFKIVAVDSWGAKSEAKEVDFTVTGATIDPNSLPQPYVDINFTSGAISDAMGHATVTNNGAALGKVTVKEGDREFKVDGITTGSGKFATGVFKGIESAADFNAFASCGFTVEAFYVNRAASTGVQGIFCATEAGGWGLAERATGVPYFIVGEGTSTNAYKNTDAKSPATKGALTHILGVYDPAAKTLSFYVNGELQATAPITGTFHAGSGDTFNKFCLGADIKPNTTAVDFPTVDMSILDAKVYNMALNSTQAGLAYSKARAEYDSRKVEYKALNILAIGNSFSVDAMEYLYPMLKDAGYSEIFLGNLYIGGCTLETHYNNLLSGGAAYTYYTNSANKWVTTNGYSSIAALESRKWDYISIQQASGYSGVADSYEPYLTEIVRIVKGKCPQAKLMFHMTWAYQGNSTHSDFPKYGNNQMTMYNGIINAVKTKVLPKAQIDFVIPSGTAIQNLRTSFIGDVVTRDGYHMSYDLGRATVAMMWAKQISGCNIDDIKTLPTSQSYTSRQIEAIKDAVQKAYEHPFEVTESAVGPLYATDDEELRKIFTDAGYDLSNYTPLKFTYTLNAYYNSTADPVSGLNTTASNSNQFAATNIMTKDDLPYGTVIVMKKGYQYRPEGWKGLATKNASASRPANVKTQIVVVDNVWWGSWVYRAFNLAKDGNPALSTADMEKLPSSIAFYVPKK